MNLVYQALEATTAAFQVRDLHLADPDTMDINLDFPHRAESLLL